jgi:hypothetical protein
LEFGSVDFNEALSVKVSSEEVADTGLNAEDGLSGTSSEVDNTIVETNSLRE